MGFGCTEMPPPLAMIGLIHRTLEDLHASCPIDGVKVLTKVAPKAEASDCSIELRSSSMPLR